MVAAAPAAVLVGSSSDTDNNSRVNSSKSCDSPAKAMAAVAINSIAHANLAASLTDKEEDLGVGHGVRGFIVL